MKPPKMYLAKVISTSFVTNTSTGTNTMVKVDLYSRTREVQQALPFGIDSNPAPNMVALYAKTGEMGAAVVIGYLYRNALAEVGETRIYSVKPDGNQSFQILLKNDGSCEIGGDGDNMVRYSPLDSGLQSMVTDINANFTTLYGFLGITPVPPITLNIGAAKIDKIKTS